MNFENLKNTINEYNQLPNKIKALTEIINLSSNQFVLGVNKEELEKELLKSKERYNEISKEFHKKNKLFNIEFGTLIDVMKEKWNKDIKHFEFYSPENSSSYTSDDFYGCSTSSHSTYFYSLVEGDSKFSYSLSQKEIIESINSGELVLLDNFSKFSPYCAASFDFSTLMECRSNFRNIKINFMPSKENSRKYLDFPLLSLSANRYFETIPDLLDILIESIKLQQDKDNKQKIEQTKNEIQSLENQLKEKKKSLNEFTQEL
ncbi:MAG: hypothetical protein PHS54_07345 [Clostridia bacterium]|nr:hypothetical protein [Clostridia bacterium]